MHAVEAVACRQWSEGAGSARQRTKGRSEAGRWKAWRAREVTKNRQHWWRRTQVSRRACLAYVGMLIMERFRGARPSQTTGHAGRHGAPSGQTG
eukprot:4656070-Prymnesium_polylepis.1